MACKRPVESSEIVWNDGALAICRDCDEGEDEHPTIFPLQEGDIIW